ncbi:uncharacterized protein LOC122371214 isoform X1 [Amphibalanus amphitrite]|uniref:uncharacterized protein LOC122371214 isoform X1 n=1 Tax=Amphibalanus amphitrite TaxID=1232801 RepID=UPI001C91AE16|nr:uncharacterized protein LOC122371214 isoform X1 [Amphibalanus amphitrite]
MNGIQCHCPGLESARDGDNSPYNSQPMASQFPCATVHDDRDKKKKSGSSKSFLPSYIHDKEIMARMVSHDYGRQWLAERDAWFEQHATSDDSLRTRMLDRCQKTEIEYVNAQKCYRDLKEQIARGRLAGSKKKYKHVQGALDTHWEPYPPIKGWRC